MSELTLAGFDRAALSLPKPQPKITEATPEQGADLLVTDTDMRQARTMGTSMAGAIGALAAAGAVVATGGVAALAVAAAAAVGAGSALTVNAAGQAADTVRADDRAERAMSGQLILTVHTTDADQQGCAERILRQAGSTQIVVAHRSDANRKVTTGPSCTGELENGRP